MWPFYSNTFSTSRNKHNNSYTRQGLHIKPYKRGFFSYMCYPKSVLKKNVQGTQSHKSQYVILDTRQSIGPNQVLPFP